MVRAAQVDVAGCCRSTSCVWIGGGNDAPAWWPYTWPTGRCWPQIEEPLGEETVGVASVVNGGSRPVSKPATKEFEGAVAATACGRDAGMACECVAG